MSDAVICVEGLSKRYRIISQQQPYYTLRDAFSQAFTAPVRFWQGQSRKRKAGNSQSGCASLPITPGSSVSSAPVRNRKGWFWAVKDASFEVKEGEVVGLIGRNGAGKSTLLKILSRITKPTAGYAEIRGRVGSLLEVGTGFHSELSGRENVYLSGAISGMSKKEIKRKFDEIVAFAGVEAFIDTPVKYYSSGMYMRLAFAVAAHLEPEILLVDEVLAVGDLEFQKKCLGKMKEVSKGGRTVLFVSHQMNQIRRLCQRAVWLDGGQIQKVGSMVEVVGAYEAAMSSGQLGRRGQGRQERGQKPSAQSTQSTQMEAQTEVTEVTEVEVPTVKARFLRWEIVESHTDQPNILASLGPVTVKFEVQLDEYMRIGNHGIILFDNEGQLIWAQAVNNLSLAPGRYEFYHSFPMLPLRPGVYSWRVVLGDDGGLLDLWQCVPEMIIATESYQHPLDQWNGILNIPSYFELNEMK